MTAPQRRLAVVVTVGVFLAALLVVLAGCGGSRDDDGCDWFALAAVEKPAPPPRPAAPAAKAPAAQPKAPEPARKAPALEKRPEVKAPAQRDGAPAVEAPTVQKPSPSPSKKARGHRGHGFDFCD